MSLLCAPSPVDEREDASLEREVVVETGTRTAHTLEQTPVDTTRIDRAAIEARGAQNVAELLDNEPEVRITRGYAGTGIRMQGLDERYTLILVDGMRATGRVGGVLDLRRLTLADLEAVDIVWGSASVLYGADAVSGVLNLVTRPPQPGWSADAQLSGGSRGRLDGSAWAGYGTKRWSLSLSGAHQRRGGWKDAPDDVATVGDERVMSQGSVRAELRPRRDTRMIWRSAYTHQDRYGVDLNASQAITDRQNRTETVQSSWQTRVEGDLWTLSIPLGHSYWRDQYAVDQRGDDALDDYQDSHDHLAQAGMQIDVGVTGHVLSVGLEGLYEQLNSPRVGEDLAQRGRLASYVQDEWQPAKADAVTLLSGFRFDYDTRFGLYLTPRGGVALSLTDKLRLRASYGRSYRAPSFREMYLDFANPSVGYRVDGNPDLRPETAWSFNADLRYRRAYGCGASQCGVELGARTFDNRLDDLITTDTVFEAPGETTRFGYVNVGSAVTRGAAGRVNLELGKHFELGGDYQWLDARNETTGELLPGRARHSGGVTSVAKVGPEPTWQTQIRTRAQVTGVREFSSAEEGEAPLLSAPFVTWDLRVGQSLSEHASVFVGVDNILGAGDAQTNPMPPRTFYLGASGRL